MDMFIGFNRGFSFFFAEFTWCFLFRNFFGAPPFLYVCVYNFYVISLKSLCGRFVTLCNLSWILVGCFLIDKFLFLSYSNPVSPLF